MFCKFYKSLFPYGDSTKFCNICFAAYDKDKSGFIDFYEYIYALSIITRGKIEEKLRLAFDIYDYNDDGFIEKKEAETIVNVSSSWSFNLFKGSNGFILFKSLLQMYGDDSPIENTRKQVNKFMVMFDNDRNGLLSEQEFIDGCLRDKDMMKFLAPNC